MTAGEGWEAAEKTQHEDAEASQQMLKKGMAKLEKVALAIATGRRSNYNRETQHFRVEVAFTVPLRQTQPADNMPFHRCDRNSLSIIGRTSRGHSHRPTVL